MEGQKLLTLISDPFGYGWNIFGTANIIMKPIISLNSIWFIQVILIFTGHIFGIYISHKHAHLIFDDSLFSFESLAYCSTYENENRDVV